MKLRSKLAAVAIVCSALFSTAADAQNTGMPSESPDFRIFPNPNQGENTYVSLKNFQAENLLVVVYEYART